MAPVRRRRRGLLAGGRVTRGRLGSGRPARNHSQDLHPSLAHALRFSTGRTLYHHFTFTFRRVYKRKGVGPLASPDGASLRLENGLARTGVVFLVTRHALLSVTAECIPSTHLEAGPGRWRPPG